MNNKKKISFLDVNIFANEGFTSGLFISIREMLKRFNGYGFDVNILLVAQGERASDWEEHKEYGHRSRTEQGLLTEEILLKEKAEDHPEKYAEAVEKLLEKEDPDVILMYTTAVFLEEYHIQTLEKALDTGKPVIMRVADSLLPTEETHDKQLVARYYSLLKRTKVVSISKALIRDFYERTGIKARYIQNLYDLNETIAKKHEYRYITLINHHPIKGREVFNEVAKRLPEKDFLVVENWPDVPEYIPPGDNVTFSKFIPDKRELFSKIKILLVPSLCEEGPARVIIESMLNGIPVVAHRIGSIPEVGDKHIHLVDPPKILGEEMEGTVLVPRLDKDDLQRTAEDFVSVIKEIDNSNENWEKNSANARRYALEYSRRSEQILKDFIYNILD